MHLIQNKAIPDSINRKLDSFSQLLTYNIAGKLYFCNMIKHISALCDNFANTCVTYVDRVIRKISLLN